MSPTNSPLVGVVMGSRNDWETMQHALQRLEQMGVAYEVQVVSAHRTPDLLVSYAKTAVERGLKVIIAGAGWCRPSARYVGIDDFAACSRRSRAEQIPERTRFPFYRSYKCPPVFQWRHLRLVPPVLPMQDCSRLPSSA